MQLLAPLIVFLLAFSGRAFAAPSKTTNIHQQPPVTTDDTVTNPYYTSLGGFYPNSAQLESMLPLVEDERSSLAYGLCDATYSSDEQAKELCDNYTDGLRDDSEDVRITEYDCTYDSNRYPAILLEGGCARYSFCTLSDGRAAECILVHDSITVLKYQQFDVEIPGPIAAHTAGPPGSVKQISPRVVATGQWVTEDIRVAESCECVN